MKILFGLSKNIQMYLILVTFNVPNIVCSLDIWLRFDFANILCSLDFILARFDVT